MEEVAMAAACMRTTTQRPGDTKNFLDRVSIQSFLRASTPLCLQNKGLKIGAVFSILRFGMERCPRVICIGLLALNFQNSSETMQRKSWLLPRFPTWVSSNKFHSENRFHSFSSLLTKL